MEINDLWGGLCLWRANHEQTTPEVAFTRREKTDLWGCFSACINYGEAFCPEEIENKSVCIDGDSGGSMSLQFQNNHCAAEQIRSTQVSTPNVELFSERS